MLHMDDPGAVETTVAALRDDKVVVIPTDTVYGLAARPTVGDAVQRIYAIKGRPRGVELPVLGASRAQLLQLGIAETAPSRALAERWWPGPLTMVFGFDRGLARPPWLAGRSEVAVRIPRHGFLIKVLEASGVLLVTSANPHGAITPSSAEDVAAALGPGVGLVVDGGSLNGEASTLVNVRHGEATVEREGALSASSITAALARPAARRRE